MANDVVGTWRLESWTVRHQDGAVSNALGEHGTGLAVFTADGWLSAHLTFDEPVQFAPDQAATYLGYAGRYRLVSDQLVTTVAISSIPAWVGTEQVRDVELAGDTLVLRPPPVGAVRHELRWRCIA